MFDIMLSVAGESFDGLLRLFDNFDHRIINFGRDLSLLISLGLARFIIWREMHRSTQVRRDLDSSEHN